jgi:hypothetical protein
MPNRVTSFNDRTLFKAARSLASGGKMTLDEALDAVDRLLDAGLLICEPPEKEEPKKQQGATPELKPAS